MLNKTQVRDVYIVKNVKLNDFINNAEKYMVEAVVADEFVTVETTVGNAVVISEAEWNILKQFAEAMLCNPEEALKLVKGN